jgi:hypothetical protein
MTKQVEVTRIIRIELDPDELWIADELDQQAKKQFRTVQQQIKQYLAAGLLRDKQITK